MENKIIKSLSKGFAFLFIIFSIFSFLFSVNIALAQNNNDYKLLAPIPGFNETYKTGDIGKYVNAIIKLSIVVAAVLAVVMITLGGFQYMTSESMGLKQEGKDKIKNAFLGLIILTSSFLILNTINPALLNFNLNIQQVGVPGNPNTNTQAPAPPNLTPGETRSYDNANLNPNALPPLEIRRGNQPMNQAEAIIFRENCRNLPGRGTVEDRGNFIGCVAPR